MGLLWLRLYIDRDVLGFLFEVDGSTVSRNVRNLLPTQQALVGSSRRKGARRRI